MFLNIGFDTLFYYVISLAFLFFPLLFYPKKDLRGERLASQVWMNVKELPRYFTVLNLLFDPKLFPAKQRINFRWILRPIIRMWKLSGITFTIKYWSEVLRLVVCYVDNHNRFLPDSQTWVKVHRGKRSLTSLAGLPIILPIQVKLMCRRVKQGIASGSLTRKDQLLFKLLLTALSFFRATSPKYSEVKVNTITGVFTGTRETLDPTILKEALRSMGWSRNSRIFVSKPSILQFSTKAGPNASLAILGIGVDLLGWMALPKKYIQYCLMCWSRGYWMLLITFVMSSVPLLPLAIVFYVLNHKPCLGRISVLEEARGKRRLIGITDWWTQVLLKPLHKDIYAFLDKLPQDGTNDQSGPIIALLKSLGVTCNVKTKGKRLQSMDLSAATDRLPVALQAQILDILGFEGELWKEILDREWYLQGQSIRYAVGQPMGAYSSFACLALTHHCIVRYASIQARIRPNKLLYAVLGDDGAMANDRVAKYYRDTFKQLGMTINPIKGFDGTVLEFAKQLWTLNGYNISPLGAKNILLFIRKVEFLPSILYELIIKRFPLFLLGKKLLPFEGSGFRNKRNYKRSAEGSSAVPTLTFKTLESLILSLFFQKRVKVDGKWVTKPTDDLNRRVRARIRVLMAIGPRSGLWYLEPKIVSWMFGDFFYGFFRRQFITAVREFGFVKTNFNVLKWIKNSDEMRFKVIEDTHRDLRDLVKQLVIFVRIPLSFIPDFKGNSPIIHSISNIMYGYIAISVPILPNLLFVILKSFNKIISKAYLILRMEILKILKYYSHHGFLSELVFGTILSWFVTFDIQSTGLAFLLGLFIEWLIRSELFGRWTRMSIHATKGYAYWPAYDPFDSSLSTLEKVADKIKLEDSGAYKQIIRMCRSSEPIRKYIHNRTISEGVKIKSQSSTVVKKRNKKYKKTTKKGA